MTSSKPSRFARVSLEDAQAAALKAAGKEAPAPTAPPKAPEPTPATAAAQPRMNAKSATSTELPRPTATVALAVYLHTPIFELAKAAFVSDFYEADGPGTFAEWVEEACRTYVAKPSATRARIAKGLPDAERGKPVQRSWTVRADLLPAIDAVCAEDAQGGTMTTRSGLVVTALRAGIQAAEKRRREPLSPIEGRLPPRLRK